MPQAEVDYLGMLQTLAAHQVDFIVVGGVCAALHGAPLVTYDLDVIHARTPDNLERLLKALGALDACYREHKDRRLVPTLSHLASPGHQLLITRLGPLDVLGTISGGRGYAELLPHTETTALAEGLQVRLLDLPTLIAVKEETARDKDRSALAVLRQTLLEKQRAAGQEPGQETPAPPPGA